MRKTSVAIMLALIVLASGCSKKPFRELTAPVFPPDSIPITVYDTTLVDSIITNPPTITPTYRRATKFEGFKISVPNNFVGYMATVRYYAPGQYVSYYLQNVVDSTQKVFLADSTGATTIPAPASYVGVRHMKLVASNVPLLASRYWILYVSMPRDGTAAIDAPIDVFKLFSTSSRVIWIRR